MWRHVQIPVELAEKIDELISEGIGYTSRAEVVREAVRSFLRQQGKI